MTPEKRIPQVLEAFAGVAAGSPDGSSRLVGAVAAHYAVQEDIARLGLADRVHVTGFVDDAQLDAWLRRVDVCLCLRWPTARETSASWLRCIAAGRATVVTDLAHTTEVPTLDPRNWTVVHARTDAAAATAAPSARDAVAVSIDILDEDHSLGLALRRLARDARLRDDLGRQAHAWWAGHHTLAHMAADYRDAIAAAIARPVPPPPEDWPPHLLDEGRDVLERVQAEIGVRADV